MQIFPAFDAAYQSLSGAQNLVGFNPAGGAGGNGFDAYLSQESAKFVEDSAPLGDLTASTSPSHSSPVQTPADGAHAQAEYAKNEAQHRKEPRIGSADFAEIREELKAYGLSDEEIKAIEERVNEHKGLSRQSFLAMIREAVKRGRTGFSALGDEEKDSLTFLFKKLGFTDEESKEIMGDLASGKTDKAMQKLVKKLGELDPNSTVAVNPDEIGALAKAFGASKDFSEQLSAAFSGGVETTPGALNDLFALVGKDAAETTKALQDKDKRLAEALDKALEKLAKKKAGEDSADAKEGKDVQHAKAKAEREREGKSKKDGGAEKSQPEGVRSESDLSPEERAKLDQTRRDQSGEGKTDARLDAAKGDKSHGKAPEDSPKREAGEQPAGFDKGLKKGFVEGEPKGVSTAASTGHGFVQAAQTEAKAAAAAKGPENPAAQKLFETVERGVLSNLADGTKRLSLELTPETLGKLNVTLTVHNKEVSAVLRAETPEAAKMLGERLDALKESLEKQGLEVTKLEVRADLSGEQNAKNWFGQNAHNQAQERREREQTLTAWRFGGRRGEAAAQAVQSEDPRANSAHQGLYLIA